MRTETKINEMYLDAEISIEQLDHHKMAIRAIKANLNGRFPIGFKACNHISCRFMCATSK